MIRSVAARENEGEVEIDYRPHGLVCRIAYRRPISAAGGNSGV
jgi:hypothetical protein